MTEYERALIIGHYLSFSVNNDIDPRLLNRGFTEDQIKQMRKAMGSQSVVSLDLEFTCSLKNIRHPNFNYIYTLHDAWERHHALPYPGTYTEQPNKVVEYFLILDQLKHESEKKAQIKAQKEAQKQKLKAKR